MLYFLGENEDEVHFLKSSTWGLLLLKSSVVKAHLTSFLFEDFFMCSF